ncbi:MAG: glycosyltransferase [Armatimonadota bacterium]
MRILYVGRNASIGGGSTFRLNMGRGMKALGHEVSIATFGGPMAARWVKAGLRFYWVPPFRIFSGMVERVMRRERIEVVHASNTTAGDRALLACRRAGLPLVLSLHNTISNEEAKHQCLKEARRIVVFDDGAAQSAGKFTSEFDTSKIIRLPRPVEHRPLDPERLSPHHVAYVARMSSRKGRVALSLLEGFRAYAKEYPQARMTLIGDGSLRGEVTRRAGEISRETGCRIDVHGPVLDPAPLLAGAGLLVGAGYAALEAAMQGRAVLGAGFNGYGLVTADAVEEAVAANFGDTVGGWEMTPENMRQALLTVTRAWDQPAERARYWGLDRVLAPIHAIENVAPRLEAVYREVLERA